MNTKTCPACGSDDIQSNKNYHVIKSDIFLNEAITVEVVEDECLLCGAEGDFESKNELELKASIDLRKKQVVKNIINALTDAGHNLAGIERALSLPQRTLSKWKNDDNSASAAGVTLLKFITFFPWLIEVAENGFDYAKAQETCAHASVNYLCKKQDPDIVSHLNSRQVGNTYVYNHIDLGIHKHFSGETVQTKRGTPTTPSFTEIVVA